MAERRIETRPIDDYPSNSKMYEPASNPEKPSLRKVKGKSVKTKRSFGRRIFESFINVDMDVIRDHVLDEIIIPEIKDALLDGLESGLEAIFGRSSYNTASSRRRSYTAYNYERPSWSSGSSKDYISTEYKAKRSEPLNAQLMAPQYVSNREDAYGLLNDMGTQIQEFGYVDLEQVKNAFGMTALSTDNNFGWTSMDGNRVRRYEGGYLIEFAPAKYLK